MCQKIEYIIVQAGGKGSRLGKITKNKPKALVPIKNLPMIFHLFRKFPESKFIVIGDYKFDVFRRYLEAFADVDYELICATGNEGTCAGLADAMSRISPNNPFMLIWSDLVLPDGFRFPKEDKNYIGVAKDFPCRWKYQDGCFVEEKTDHYGVSGLFIFKNSADFKDVPPSGEFVRWLSTTDLEFDELPLYKVEEYGLLEKYNQIETEKCRPFNRIYKEDDLFVKEAIDEQGKMLANREINWYKSVEGSSFDNIPKIYRYEPLKMNFISGRSIYEYENLTYDEKYKLLKQIVDCLKSIHEIGSVDAEEDSFYEAYIGKTFGRLEKVQELVPFAKDERIIINGRSCRNIFFCREEIENIIRKWMPEKFAFIHGDCTFSNIMYDETKKKPILIDPRGYFGNTELYGDVAYDWAKLYYSIKGDYDQFNRKRFSLAINDSDVELIIESNGWSELEDEFLSMIENEVSKEQLHLLHAIIWLSLTTYAWENYDSICGAFYNGLYYLEEALNENLL